MHDVVGVLRRTVRRFTLGSGPLKRGCDRLQFLSRALVLVVIVLAVPVGLTVGLHASAALARTVARQAADRHEVTATVLPPGSPSADGSERIAWAGPGGATHVVPVAVGLDAGVGSTIPVWVDRNGKITGPPMTPSDAIAMAIIRSTLVFLGLAGLTVGGYRGLVSALDRRRARLWTAEWDAIEPRWSGRVP